MSLNTLNKTIHSVKFAYKLIQIEFYMKNIFFFLILLGLFTSTSCKDDGGGNLGMLGDVTLKFKAFYGDEPLIMNQAYTYVDGTPIKFSKFQFFISNISLGQETGGITDAVEVDLIDFTDSTDPTMAAEGFSMIGSDIPVGNYSTINFGVGVAADLNRTKPADYGNTHPLSETTDYWSGWESYIFTKIEGRLDLDGDGVFDDQSIVYHLGGDDAFRDAVYAKAFTVEEDATTTVNLDIDLSKILVRSETDYFDITNTNAIHEDEVLVGYLMDNYSTAISIE